MLFPGQGSQYVGMLRELACLFPRMQAALAGMNEAARSRCHRRARLRPDLSARGVRRRGRQAREDALRDTRFAQPAIGAVSLGLLGILEDFGVRADLVGGHSFGELTALRAAGRIDDAGAGACSPSAAARSWPSAPAEGSGAMLAAFAPLEEVASVIREHALDLVDRQQERPPAVRPVGPGRGDRAQPHASWRIAGITTRVVPVSAAFHSRFVAAAREPFRRALDAVAMAPVDDPRLRQRDGRALPRRPRRCPRPAGRPARPAGRVRRPGRGDVPDGSADIPRSRPRRQAHRPGPIDPRGPRPPRRRRRCLARVRRQRRTTWPARSQPWLRWGMLLT